MKKIRILCLLLCAALLLSLPPLTASATQTTESLDVTETTGATEQSQPEGTYKSGAGDSSVYSGCHSINAQVPLWGNGKLLETAGSAMLYEINSDTVVYGWNMDQQMYPASLVKIMTVLIAVERGNLTDKITVSSSALSAMPRNSTLNFAVGEVWTLEDFLYCLMVGNFNDAAVIIAEHIAGSQQRFLAMMNERAQQLGCTSTFFANPTGFHDSTQVTTARDMVKILREAIKNEDFLPFFSETIYRLPANDYSESRYMESSNFMMTTDVTAEYYDPRVTGGRTGVTESRERCLIVTAESKGLHYISIVLGAISTSDEEGEIVRFGSYEEVKELLELGFEGYQVTQVLSNRQSLIQYAVNNGENSVIAGPSKTMYTVLPSEITSDDLSIRFEQTIPALDAPVETGQPITTVQVWYGNVCVAQSPVIAMNSSAVFGEEQTDPDAQRSLEGVIIALRVIGILVAVALCAAGVLYVIRAMRRASRRAQHRRRRRNRRRSR